jgi:hypothetical protein
MAQQPSLALYEVVQTFTGCHIVQIQADSSRLNTNHSYILITPMEVFVWFGSASSQEERQTAIGVVEEEPVLRLQTQTILEDGQEEDENWQRFWSVLGEKKEHFSIAQSKTPRLFHCSNASGNFAVDELFDYSQDDLNNEDVMILDCFDRVFLWEGTKSSKEEKKQSLQTTLDYCTKHPDERAQKIPNWDQYVYVVKAGKEPLEFISCFFGTCNEI